MSFVQYGALAVRTARRYGYDPALLCAQVEAESGWNPKAQSKAGAKGLGQFMDATWREWGRGADVYDPAANLDAMVRYMMALRQHSARAASPVELAFASYNWGQGHVDRAVKETGRTDWGFLAEHMPEETRTYVSRILGWVPKYRALLGPITAAGVAFLVVLLGLALLRRTFVPAAS